jgi:SAM-dependent methyltransferase
VVQFGDERLSREREFHNERFGAPEARRKDAFHFAIANGAEEYGRRVREAARGRDVLEYGCTGGASVALAASARSLAGIDISDVAIAQAVAAASAAGLDRARFQVDDAQHMSLPSDAFDLVCGSAIIHHLDVETAVREVRRVLRPGGRAIFWEPLGQNALP